MSAPEPALPPWPAPGEAFALLDDESADGQVRARLYLDPAGEITDEHARDLTALEARALAALAEGLHLVLLADYEWGVRLQRHAQPGGPGTRAASVPPAPDRPGVLRLLAFRTLHRLDAAATADWLAGLEARRTARDEAARGDAADRPAALADGEPGPAGLSALRPAIDAARHAADIARIHAAIRDGETYQVNHTLRLDARAWGDPVALYRRLRGAQPVGFGALIHRPGGRTADGAPQDWVLSRSPELFVQHERGTLRTRPMKGTAPASGEPVTDEARREALRADPKNRAENLMIVDLLRNDLGRLAEPGSVQVPALFSVERYATVLQMTSTVTARRRADVGLGALLTALFPCGSITGAPKGRTMDWIAALEDRPRGLYCGAIGWLDAPQPVPAGHRPCPELCLSVAIRTLVMGEPDGADPAWPGTRPVVLGVGGGIVLDSDPASEWEEAHWKARFVQRPDPGLELFETFAWPPQPGRPAPAAHRARLAASAAALGWPFDPAAFDTLLAGLAAPAAPGEPSAPRRVRVALRADGHLRLDAPPLPPLAPAWFDAQGRVRLVLAEAPLRGERPLAGHKTTWRARYDAGVRAAEAAGAFDTLFFDAQGRLLEGGRSSVLVRLDGRWCTPPRHLGVLPGLMRAHWLADPALDACERVITRADLARAEALRVGNALRGTLHGVIPGLGLSAP